MTSEPIPPQLAEERRTIDNIDAALIHILAERFRCTQRVGHLKVIRHHEVIKEGYGNEERP